MSRTSRPGSARTGAAKAGTAKTNAVTSGGPDQWRHDNIGRLLNNAVRRFEDRVLELMTAAGYADTRISHVNLTRNLDRDGTRITELASRAGMTKQAMSELVEQCEGIGLVRREIDPADKRARIIHFTRLGLQWLEAFSRAVDRAEQEMRVELGQAKHDAVRNALKLYGSEHDVLAK